MLVLAGGCPALTLKCSIGFNGRSCLDSGLSITVFDKLFWRDYLLIDFADLLLIVRSSPLIWFISLCICSMADSINATDGKLYFIFSICSRNSSLCLSASSLEMNFLESNAGASRKVMAFSVGASIYFLEEGLWFSSKFDFASSFFYFSSLLSLSFICFMASLIALISWLLFYLSALLLL